MTTLEMSPSAPCFSPFSAGASPAEAVSTRDHGPPFAVPSSTGFACIRSGSPLRTDLTARIGKTAPEHYPSDRHRPILKGCRETTSAMIPL